MEVENKKEKGFGKMAQTYDNDLIVSYTKFTDAGIVKVENVRLSEISEDEKKDIFQLVVLPIKRPKSEGPVTISDKISGFARLESIYLPAKTSKGGVNLKNFKECPNLRTLFFTELSEFSKPDNSTSVRVKGLPSELNIGEQQSEKAFTLLDVNEESLKETNFNAELLQEGQQVSYICQIPKRNILPQKPRKPANFVTPVTIDVLNVKIDNILNVINQINSEISNDNHKITFTKDEIESILKTIVDNSVSKEVFDNRFDKLIEELSNIKAGQVQESTITENVGSAIVEAYQDTISLDINSKLESVVSKIRTGLATRQNIGNLKAEIIKIAVVLDKISNEESTIDTIASQISTLADQFNTYLTETSAQDRTEIIDQITETIAELQKEPNETLNAIKERVDNTPTMEEISEAIEMIVNRKYRAQSFELKESTRILTQTIINNAVSRLIENAGGIYNLTKQDIENQTEIWADKMSEIQSFNEDNVKAVIDKLNNVATLQGVSALKGEIIGLVTTTIGIEANTENIAFGVATLLDVLNEYVATSDKSQEIKDTLRNEIVALKEDQQGTILAVTEKLGNMPKIQEIQEVVLNSLKTATKSQNIELTEKVRKIINTKTIDILKQEKGQHNLTRESLEKIAEKISTEFTVLAKSQDGQDQKLTAIEQSLGNLLTQEQFDTELKTLNASVDSNFTKLINLINTNVSMPISQMQDTLTTMLLNQGDMVAGKIDNLPTIVAQISLGLHNHLSIEGHKTRDEILRHFNSDEFQSTLNGIVSGVNTHSDKLADEAEDSRQAMMGMINNRFDDVQGIVDQLVGAVQTNEKNRTNSANLIIDYLKKQSTKIDSLVSENAQLKAIIQQNQQLQQQTINIVNQMNSQYEVLLQRFADMQAAFGSAPINVTGNNNVININSTATDLDIGNNGLVEGQTQTPSSVSVTEPFSTPIPNPVPAPDPVKSPISVPDSTPVQGSSSVTVPPRPVSQQVPVKSDPQNSVSTVSTKPPVPHKKNEPNKPEKLKLIKDTVEKIDRLKEPKLPWYKRVGKFAIRHPFRTALIGMGIGLLGATGIGAIAAGSLATALNTVNLFLPTILVGGGIGAVAGLAATIVSRFSKKGRKERLYTKFKKQYKKCNNLREKAEHYREEQQLRLDKIAELRESSRTGNRFLKKMGVYRFAKKFNRKKLRKLQVKEIKTDFKADRKTEKALNTKTKLNYLENITDKTLAYGGYIQKKKNLDKKVREGRIDPEDYSDKVEDLLEEAPAIATASQEVQTFDGEAEDLILNVKTKNRSMVNILNSIQKRHSIIKTKLVEEEKFDTPENRQKLEDTVKEDPAIEAELRKKYDAIKQRQQAGVDAYKLLKKNNPAKAKQLEAEMEDSNTEKEDPSK